MLDLNAYYETIEVSQQQEHNYFSPKDYVGKTVKFRFLTAENPQKANYARSRLIDSETGESTKIRCTVTVNDCEMIWDANKSKFDSIFLACKRASIIPTNDFMLTTTEYTKNRGYSYSVAPLNGSSTSQPETTESASMSLDITPQDVNQPPIEQPAQSKPMSANEIVEAIRLRIDPEGTNLVLFNKIRKELHDSAQAMQTMCGGINISDVEYEAIVRRYLNALAKALPTGGMSLGAFGQMEKEIKELNFHRSKAVA